MIDANRCDTSDLGIPRIYRVQSAAKSDLHDRHIDVAPAKAMDSCQCGEFKISQLDIASDSIYQRKGIAEFFSRYRFVVNYDTLVKLQKMWGGINAGHQILTGQKPGNISNS